mmetsp:Transcript_3204/g.8211  ORF Transcript_3204/g.8211 Transcript_3204/m.8211 type:complete len:202 (+) Transcript_3204:413-1018(+)
MLPSSNVPGISRRRWVPESPCACPCQSPVACQNCKPVWSFWFLGCRWALERLFHTRSESPARRRPKRSPCLLAVLATRRTQDQDCQSRSQQVSCASHQNFPTQACAPGESHPGDEMGHRIDPGLVQGPHHGLFRVVVRPCKRRALPDQSVLTPRRTQARVTDQALRLVFCAIVHGCLSQKCGLCPCRLLFVKCCNFQGLGF